MKSFNKRAIAMALAFAAIAAGSAPALAQYAGLPYGAHRVYGTHPNQVIPRARAYNNYAAPGAFYDYAAPGYGYSAPGAYYDYVAPNYRNPAAGVPSQFYECPPKCW